MSTCCQAVGARHAPPRVRRGREILAWALPSAVLVLVPKCPACLAAQVTLWTGLGLSLSYDIVVQQHGGRLTVDSDPGAFTEFVVTLPRTVAAARVPA